MQQIAISGVRPPYLRALTATGRATCARDKDRRIVLQNRERNRLIQYVACEIKMGLCQVGQCRNLEISSATHLRVKHQRYARPSRPTVHVVETKRPRYSQDLLPTRPSPRAVGQSILLYPGLAIAPLRHPDLSYRPIKLHNLMLSDGQTYLIIVLADPRPMSTHTKHYIYQAHKAQHFVRYSNNFRYSIFLLTSLVSVCMLTPINDAAINKRLAAKI